MAIPKRRKKRTWHGLNGIKLKPVQEKQKSVGETVLLIGTHFGAAALGATGGAFLEKKGLWASAGTLLAGVRYAGTHPRLGTHLIAGGAAMLAGPAFAALNKRQGELKGFDLDREWDEGNRRVAAFWGTGMKRSLYLDRFTSAGQAPAATIEQEAARATTTAMDGLGNAPRHFLEAAPRGGQHQGQHPEAETPALNPWETVYL